MGESLVDTTQFSPKLVERVAAAIEAVIGAEMEEQDAFFSARADDDPTIALDGEFDPVAVAIAALEASGHADLEEALTPSGDTKAAYMGEFAFSLTRVDEAGDEYPEKVYVPWTTIKEIMAAIRERAALSLLRGGSDA